MSGIVRNRLAAGAGLVALLAIGGVSWVALPVLQHVARSAHRIAAGGRDHGPVVPIEVAWMRAIAARVLPPVIDVIEPITVGPAEAQTRLGFTPVSEESARALERRVAARREADRASAATSARPAAGSSSASPSAPIPPPPPVEPTAPLPPSNTGNIVQIGSDIHIEKGQVVDGDVLSINSDIRVDGHVRGNVSATRGDVTLGSTARVDGDVLCLGGELHEEDGAWVGGQRVTGLEGRERRARMRERIREHVRDRVEDRIGREIDVDDEGSSRVHKLMRSLAYTLMWLGIAWVVAHFAAGRTRTALRSLQQEPGMSLGLGFLGILMLVPSVVALALVVAVLCITIIGIPVALGVLLAYAGLLIVLAGWGAVVGYTALGERLSARAGRSAPTLAASAVWGVLALHALFIAGHVLHLIPFFGGFGTLLRVLGIVAYCMLVLLGMGALLRSKFGQGPEGRWWPPQFIFGAPPPAGVPPAPAPGAGWPAPAPMPPPPPPPVVPSTYMPPPPPIDPDPGPGGLSASTPPPGETPPTP